MKNVCVCVCVRERERMRENEKYVYTGKVLAIEFQQYLQVYAGHFTSTYLTFPVKYLCEWDWSTRKIY